MTAEHFETTLDVLISARPFKPFTIELNTGQRIEIDHRGAILWADASTPFSRRGMASWSCSITTA